MPQKLEWAGWYNIRRDQEHRLLYFATFGASYIIPDDREKPIRNSDLAIHIVALSLLIGSMLLYSYSSDYSTSLTPAILQLTAMMLQWLGPFLLSRGMRPTGEPFPSADLWASIPTGVVARDAALFGLVAVLFFAVAAFTHRDLSWFIAGAIFLILLFWLGFLGYRLRPR
jgi:hypothetical protein